LIYYIFPMFPCHSRRVVYEWVKNDWDAIESTHLSRFQELEYLERFSKRVSHPREDFVDPKDPRDFVSEDIVDMNHNQFQIPSRLSK